MKNDILPPSNNTLEVPPKAVGRRKSALNMPKSLRKTIESSTFAKYYLIASVIILLATTLLWSILGAHVQQSNADQLVNPLLFEHLKTLHGALIPGQHTFLLKWPLFFLIGLFGGTLGAIGFFSVALVMITVGLLAWVLYRIDRRPLVFGTLCLALASVLLLIPTQPYPGGLLPTNMAMLTTRNIEYIFYIAGLYLVIKAKKMRSWHFAGAVVVLALLFASDKLFLSIGAAGALIGLLMYALLQNWKFVSLFANWLVATLLGGVVAEILLLIINASGIAHIVNIPTVGPYGLIHSLHAFILGVFYAVLGGLTNLGANPAINDTVVRHIPNQVGHGLASPSLISYLVNIAVCLAGLYGIFRLTKTTTKRKSTRQLHSPLALSMMLLASSLSAVAVFVLSNHDDAVDARYLGIFLFAIFVSFAAYSLSKHWQPQKIVIVGGVLLVSILLGLFGVGRNYSREVTALGSQNQRNKIVLLALDHHPVSSLVGDYWRVIPIKVASKNTLNVVPLSSCTQVRNSLTSESWNVDLHKHSFAYLLSLDGSLTDFPNCSISQIVADYGPPDQSSLIAGSLSHPKELLLFYDSGIVKTHKHSLVHSAGPSTILPISLGSLTDTICSKPTVMNIVAHEDDDLLFMNPDLYSSISNGECVRTIYITAGDGGYQEFYWINREDGVEAAYSSMLGSKAVWIQRIVELNSHEYLTVANPRGNDQVTLIFMHLPDGNLMGQGFSNTNYESLQKLEMGKIKDLNSVDGQSYYSSEDLVNALTALMHTYQPAEIRTQANYVSTRYPDHSDHIAVGNYATAAYKQYDQQQYGDQVSIPLKYYIGYPIHAMSANVSGSSLQEKIATFLAYAKHDAAVCQTEQQCLQSPEYGSYLTREYQYKS